MTKVIVPKAERTEIGESLKQSPNTVEHTITHSNKPKVTEKCSADGWPELKRDRLDKTKRHIINLCSDRKTDRIPCHTWKNYNWRQHYNDVMGRVFIRHTVI